MAAITSTPWFMEDRLLDANQQQLENVIVVDANLDDYEPLVAELDSRSIRVHLIATGEAALRGALLSGVWIVNAQLPDMAGVALLGLIRRRVRRASVLLVGDEYSPVDELAARLAGANAYV